MNKDLEKLFDEKFQALAYRNYAKNGGEKSQWKYDFTIKLSKSNEKTIKGIKEWIDKHYIAKEDHTDLELYTKQQVEDIIGEVDSYTIHEDKDLTDRGKRQFREDYNQAKAEMRKKLNDRNS